MSAAPRDESAAALARSPLFSRLGRVDRARLAGELEELAFEPGAVIVKEGDPGDALYVINLGLVNVMVTGRSGESAAANVLGPGEVFGEMALLTDSPRAASIVARTPVTVWKLSRARFDALLDHERPIARAIEQALSQRLAASTHELGTVRATGRHLVSAATKALPLDARSLLAGLASRPAWDAEVVARLVQATGGNGALSVLDAVPGLIRRDGGKLTIDPGFIELADGQLGRGSPAWLAAATAELGRAGDLVGAVELALEAGLASEASRLLAEGKERLEETATTADVDRWVTRMGAEPDLGRRLAGLRMALETRRAARPAEDAPAAGRRSVWQRLAALIRRIGPAELGGALAALAIVAAGLLLPVPDGLTRPGMVTLAAVLATVPLLMADTLPDYVVVLLLTVGLVVPGLVPSSAILGGFATPSWLMILTLLAVGAAVARSGLMFRLVLLSLERLPPSYLVQSLVLVGGGVLLTAGMTSVATRIALAVPITRGIADAMGFARQTPGAAAVGLLGFYTFSLMGTLFITGTFTGLVIHDLLPPLAKAQITWWKWFFVTAPLWVLLLAAMYAYLQIRFQPHKQARVNLTSVHTQRQLLGPLTRNEIWSAVGLVLLTIGFATRAYHGVAPAWLAVALFLVLFVVGAIDGSSIQGGGALGLLIYSGVVLSFSDVFAAQGIDAWLSGVVRSGMPGFVTNPYGFIVVVAGISFVLHFFVPWMTASTILALVTMPLAEGLGFHPFIPVIVILFAGDHTIVPYVNTSYAMFYFATEGELFSHAQARMFLVVEAILRFLVCLACVPIWQLVGMM
jgi:CRP-like cAMP-binding protein/di/tricarboxylate transporter